MDLVILRERYPPPPRDLERDASELPLRHSAESESLKEQFGRGRRIRLPSIRLCVPIEIGSQSREATMSRRLFLDRTAGGEERRGGAGARAK